METSPKCRAVCLGLKVLSKQMDKQWMSSVRWHYDPYNPFIIATSSQNHAAMDSITAKSVHANRVVNYACSWEGIATRNTSSDKHANASLSVPC